MPRPPKANKDKIQQQPIPVPTAVMPAANAAVAPRNVEVENFMRVRDSVSFLIVSFIFSLRVCFADAPSHRACRVSVAGRDRARGGSASSCFSSGRPLFTPP